ncbi:uncharacterized protein LOC142345843 [Convolutriloba macropyga]|uniref:uncharacterized protein LOC142345843 n=1 Tax=Convolutriloba macropyga TaxID=536237 RepID=UPI003F51ED94
MTVSDFDEDLVLELLSEHILDKKEIATVSWLSKSQNITSLQSRACMGKFYAKNNNKVKATYFLSYYKDNSLKMSLSTNESPESLNDVEILSRQLFSLQTFEPKDLASLCLPLKDELNYTKPTIKYPTDNVSKSADNRGGEVSRDDPKQQPKAAEPKGTTTKSATTSSKNKGSGSLQSMFGSNSSASANAKPAKTSSAANAKSNQSKKQEAMKNDIGKAFKNAEANAINAKPSKTEATSPEKSNDNLSKRTADEGTDERSPPKKKQKQATGKHKRVIMDDSDEEEMGQSLANQNEDEQNSEVESESGEKSPMKENRDEDESRANEITAPVTKIGRRRKVLKDVTHVDEEGFLITDKVWQEESCSEDETASSANSNVVRSASGTNQTSVKLPEMINKVQPDESFKAKAKSTKSSGSVKKNQGSLFSFFGKK